MDPRSRGTSAGGCPLAPGGAAATGPPPEGRLPATAPAPDVHLPDLPSDPVGPTERDLIKGPSVVAAIETLAGILERMTAHQDKKSALLRELRSWRRDLS
jgi:hypothetical protein